MTARNNPGSNGRGITVGLDPDLQPAQVQVNPLWGLGSGAEQCPRRDESANLIWCLTNCKDNPHLDTD